MLISDESRLNADFEELKKRLQDPDALNPVHGAPVFYFVYAPKHILTVRRLLPGWIARMKNEHGLTVKQVSLSEITWNLIDESGRWEEWLGFEDDFDLEDVNESVRSVLRDNAFVERVTEQVVDVDEKMVVFITDVELLHPYFRTRPIENYLNNRVQSPTVFFYPGLRDGQYGLKFLEFYPVDPGYRSTLIGGMA